MTEDSTDDGRTVDDDGTNGSGDETKGNDNGTDGSGDATTNTVESESEPDAVGDGRPKFVEVVTADGERHEHGDSYLRQSKDAFVVSPEPEFPSDQTVTYRKKDLSRVSVDQHHSSCFITTAVAGEERTLTALRDFRDDALSPSPVGRPLVAVYERISPPIARTLAERSDGATALTVRWLVRRCAALARRRESADGVARSWLTISLVALYVVGVAVAATGHVAATTAEYAATVATGRRGGRTRRRSVTE